MLDFWWQAHADLLQSCDSKAEFLHSAITAAVTRIIAQADRDSSSENFATTAEAYQMLDTCQEFARRTQRFCTTMALSNKGYGSSSPFDTQPASSSTYAWIPMAVGETPVSPMRALWQLEGYLNNGIKDVEKL
jgi:hypothetical protein